MRHTCRLFLLLAAGLSVTLTACSNNDSLSGKSTDRNRVVAVATTTQVADLVRNVGGSRIDLRQILKPNSDPHSYEPKPSDAEALINAKVIFSSGGDLDSWLNELADSAGTEAKTVILINSMTVGSSDRSSKRLSAGSQQETHDKPRDPHWWQNPRNSEVAVREIAKQLIALDPANRTYYHHSAANYLAKLKQLDRSVASCIGKIPQKQRKLVTDHDALGYFADRYGLQIVGTVIPSLSTQAQASAGAVAKLIEKIRSERVRAIFPESSVSTKLARSIAQETDAEVGQPLWADTLGPSNSTGATYIGSIQANATAVVKGLTDSRKSCNF